MVGILTFGDAGLCALVKRSTSHNSRFGRHFSSKMWKNKRNFTYFRVPLINVIILVNLIHIKFHFRFLQPFWFFLFTVIFYRNQSCLTLKLIHKCCFQLCGPFYFQFKTIVCIFWVMTRQPLFWTKWRTDDVIMKKDLSSELNSR